MIINIYHRILKIIKFRNFTIKILTYLNIQTYFCFFQHFYPHTATDHIDFNNNEYIYAMMQKFHTDEFYKFISALLRYTLWVTCDVAVKFKIFMKNHSLTPAKENIYARRDLRVYTKTYGYIVRRLALIEFDPKKHKICLCNPITHKKRRRQTH